MAKATYFYNGVDGLQWIRLDENPFCKTLENKVVDMGRSCRGVHFVVKGDEVQGRSELSQRSKVLTASWNVATPPLFGGCECQIAPVVRRGGE
jgi:hypothetical protein